MRSFLASESQLTCGVLPLAATSLMMPATDLVPAIGTVYSSECAEKPHLVSKMVIEFHGAQVEEPVAQPEAVLAPVPTAVVETAAPVAQHCSGCIFNQGPSTTTVEMPQTGFLAQQVFPQTEFVAQTMPEVVSTGQYVQSASPVVQQMFVVPAAHKVYQMPYSMTAPGAAIAAPPAPTMMGRLMALLGQSGSSAITEAAPATLNEFLYGEFQSEQLKRDQEFVHANYSQLRSNYLRVIQPYLFDAKDASYLINDETFYQWLKGSNITAAIRERINETAEQNHAAMIAELADKFLAQPRDAASVVEDDVEDEDEEDFGEEYLPGQTVAGSYETLF